MYRVWEVTKSRISAGESGERLPSFLGGIQVDEPPDTSRGLIWVCVKNGISVQSPLPPIVIRWQTKICDKIGCVVT